MAHLIMGTAGHIDHGKTALIKALTGFNCDTHPEEKKRGITINLGFSALDIDNDTKIGVVDVPGHRDFVHTMVGGAFGVDFVLFVIAADSGVMPQTKEHLKILEILGVKKGIVVLNKIDLVDDELLALTKEEVSNFLRGTFLEDAPIQEVSATTSKGIDDLQNSIKKISQTIEEREEGEIFRLYIDRIFSIKGFGTVVTGTVIGGNLQIDDKVYLLPENKTKLRIRRMEKHGQEVKNITTGDRASINLVGLERADFERGMLISDRILEPSTRIDVKCSIFENITELKLWTQVIFLCGTNEIQAKLHLLDKNTLKGGETGVAQIVLSKPAVIFNNDSFIIRNTSSNITLGGGKVLDAHPLHHKRRTEKMIVKVNKIAQGNLKDLIVEEVFKRYEIINSNEIADNLNCSQTEIVNEINNNCYDNVYTFNYDDNTILLLQSEYDRIKERVLMRIKGYHRRNPYESTGMALIEFLSIFSFEENSSGEIFLKHLLKQLEKEKLITHYKNTWIKDGYKVNLNNDMQNKINWLENNLKGWEMQTPLMSELIPDAKRQNINEDELKKILYYLTKIKKVYEIEDDFIHSSIVDNCRNTLLNTLIKNKDGLRVAEFRNLVGGNRKICLLLLGQYDSEKIVERKDDKRVITEKGRMSIK